MHILKIERIENPSCRLELSGARQSYRSQGEVSRAFMVRSPPREHQGRHGTPEGIAEVAVRHEESGLLEPGFMLPVKPRLHGKLSHFVEIGPGRSSPAGQKDFHLPAMGGMGEFAVLWAQKEIEGAHGHRIGLAFISLRPARFPVLPVICFGKGLHHFIEGPEKDGLSGKTKPSGLVDEKIVPLHMDGVVS
jgi:hypothetical protein